jgi:hypothetical protein
MAKKTAATKVAAKRPRDVNQLAHFLVQATTEREIDETKPAVSQSDISRVMAELGRRGGKIGGKRRMDTLSQERRSQIALQAAQARWGTDVKKS